MQPFHLSLLDHRYKVAIFRLTKFSLNRFQLGRLILKLTKPLKIDAEFKSDTDKIEKLTNFAERSGHSGTALIVLFPYIFRISLTELQCDF